MRPEDFAPLPRLLTFTVDVEDHRPADDGGGGSPPRFPALTLRLLDLLDEHEAKGTFFLLGEAAAQAPALVREIARRGHEVAAHGERHTALPRQRPADFLASLRRCKALLEDLAGGPVLGFRAPMFSLTRDALWAPGLLAEAGFAYSSSVLPAWSFAFGLPGAPRVPFLWPSGLLEIPCPVGRVGPLTLPFLGGMYLRYLPPWRLRQLARTVATDVIWTYCHPYDVDTDEPFARARGRGLVASLFLWGNRSLTLDRLRLLMNGRRSVSFAARLPELRARAVPFDPRQPAPA